MAKSPRRTRARQCGNLVTQGFSATGGHQYQGVTALDHGLDDTILWRAEGGVTEYAMQDVWAVFIAAQYTPVAAYLMGKQMRSLDRKHPLPGSFKEKCI